MIVEDCAADAAVGLCSMAPLQLVQHRVHSQHPADRSARSSCDIGQHYAAVITQQNRCKC